MMMKLLNSTIDVIVGGVGEQKREMENGNVMDKSSGNGRRSFMHCEDVNSRALESFANNSV